MPGVTYKPESTLRFRGRTYVLFRRSGSTSPYCLRLQHDGKRRLLSTSTADLTLAKAQAKDLIAEVLDGKRKPKRTTQVPTIGEVLDAMKGGDRHVRSQTARDYELCLLRILKSARDWNVEEARAKKIDVLTADLVRDFQALKQGTSTVDHVTPMKINTSINSAVRQARGVFSRRLVAAYEGAGMVMPPTLDGFLRAPFLREVSHRYSDNPIPQSAIDAMNEELPKKKAEDERLWAIHLMIRLMGLRDSEIVKAQRFWLVERGGKTYLVINRREGDAPKRKDGEVAVPAVLLEWFEWQPGEFLIPAKNPTERRDLVYKEHSKWIRTFLPGRTKTNHELRKWAGSLVATKTNSWERAAEFLRIDLETAKLHYLAFTEPVEPLSMEDL